MIHPMGEIVVVTGADGPVGRRVVGLALDEPGVDRVVAVGRDLGDHPAGSRRGGDVELVAAPFALDDPRLAALVRGATRLLHLGARRGLDLDGTGGADVDLLGTRALLSTLAQVGHVGTVVVLSSALVYGARSTNPVPLTEASPVRPNPSIPAAVERAQLEGMVRSWSVQRGASCAMVRPAVVVGPENGRWLARSPWSTAGLRVSGADAPVQFLHVDDLAAAVVTVCRAGADGPVNAAPDGWLTVDQVKALKGPAPRLRVPRALAVRLTRIGARLGLANDDPATVLAASEPWVVANDRLRGLGWVPEQTNEEAYVDADRGGPWARLTPRHRQQIALGGMGVVVLGGLGVGAWLLRRRLRRGR
jgi:nucleoside-diphosphate-sugar epimerase